MINKDAIEDLDAKPKAEEWRRAMQHADEDGNDMLKQLIQQMTQQQNFL